MSDISIPLNEYRFAPDHVVEHLATELVDAERGSRRARSVRDLIGFQSAVSAIIANAAHANTIGNGCTVRIRLQKNYYSSLARYRNANLTHTHIKSAYEGLIGLGYLFCAKRGSFSSGKMQGQTTRYSATEQLLNLFAESDQHQFLYGSYNPDVETIILRAKTDGVRKAFDYDDTDETHKWRDNLKVINRCLNNHWFDLYLPDDQFKELAERCCRDADRESIDFSKRSLRRVFTQGRFDHGGRFYGGWWQNIPSDYRPDIHIDYKDTIEYDFSELNPTILYSQAGVSCNGDAYSISGVDRDVVKSAFNAMVQASTPLMHKPKDIDLSCSQLTWKELRQQILNKHEAIADKFFDGYGNELQFLDSQVAEQIVLGFAKHDIPCLPIHDSFIMHHGYAGELEHAMHRAFKDVFNAEVNIKAEERVRVKSPLSVNDGTCVMQDLSLDALLDYDRQYSQYNKRTDGFFAWRSTQAKFST